MTSSDDLFRTLPFTTQRAIDYAFNITVNPSFVRRSKRSKRTPGSTSRSGAAPITGGGFIIDDDVPMGGGFIPEDTPAGGGFVVDDEPMHQGLPEEPQTEDQEDPTHIRFEQIPAALQRLDLPPDDPEVLSVFKNAASGWTSSSPQAPGRVAEPDEQYVSREDFRSVCSVLLEHQGPASPREALLGDGDNDDVSDEYQEERDSPESSEPEEVEDSDEYDETPSNQRSKRRKWKGKGKEIDLGNPQKLTVRQEQVCLDTFALFFPDTPISDLPNQKLMIKNIQASFKLLGETLKAEDLIEMVEMFSTSPDKSMSFADFSKMMVVAKLA